MTVSTSLSRVSYATDGTTGPFTVPFPFLDDSHLLVTYTSSAGVETTLALGADYSVTGAGGASGTVTTVTAYAAGATLTITREIEILQELDLVDGADFPADSIERAFDLLTMVAQSVDEKVNGALRVPEAAVVLPAFPVAASRANMLASFDEDGNPAVVAPSSGTATDLALNLVNTTDAAKGGALVKLSALLAYPQNSLGWAFNRGFMVATGLAGDGVADDGAAINAQLDLLEANGGGTMVLPWPATDYLIGTKIQVPSHCRLIGVGGTDPSGEDGTHFVYAGTGEAIVCKDGENPANSVRGVVIEHVGVRLTGAGSTGFKVRQARDVLMIGCAVEMDADSQTGIHLEGSRLVTTATGTLGAFTITVASATGIVAGLPAYGTGIASGAVVVSVVGTTVTLDLANDATVSGNVGFGTGGVFEAVIIAARSYCADGMTNALHYRMSGTAGLGQCNVNHWIAPRAGGAGVGMKVGPSLVNTVAGASFENLSGHYFHCESGAVHNEFSVAYLGDQFSTTLNSISNASPAVITYSGTDRFGNDMPVKFTTTGSLPTGLTADTVYYVKNVNTTANTFEVSATVGGASINTSSAGSGTHTAKWGGKLLHCDAGAQYNELRKYRVGGGAGEETLELNGANNQAEHILGDKFIGTPTARAFAIRVQGESNNRLELRGHEIRMGGGSAAPIRVFPGGTVETTAYSAALGTFTPDILTGRAKFVRLDAGSSGTLTIATPTNGPSSTDTDVIEFEIFNNSGGSLNLTWSGYTVAATPSALPTSIATGKRLYVAFRYFSTLWVQMGSHMVT